MPNSQLQKTPVGFIVALLVAAAVLGVAKFLFLDQFRKTILDDEIVKQSQNDIAVIAPKN